MTGCEGSCPNKEIYIKLENDEWQFGTKTNGVVDLFEESRVSVVDCLYCFIDALQGKPRPNLRLVKE
jgi:hypothetical protein